MANRFLLFFTTKKVLFLPHILLLLLLLFFAHQWKKIQKTDSEAQEIFVKEDLYYQKRIEKKALLKRFSNPYDPKLLETHLSAIPLTPIETKKMEKLVKKFPFSKEENKKRLTHLTTLNRLSFIEKELNDSSFWKKTHLLQKSPVEIEEKELEKVLTLVEGENSSIVPFYSIEDFSLKKKNDGSSFILNMTLLKKERAIK